MDNFKGFSKYGLTIGQIYKSNRCGNFEIVEFKDCYNILIKFISTGTAVYSTAANIKRGSVRDRNFPTIFGVGCLGYGRYKSRNSKEGPKTKQYGAWENMLARCYYPKTSRYSAYGGKGVKVCENWLNFQNFAKWFDENYIEGYHLDKDLLGDGMIYSPNTCIYVPQHINGLLVNNTCNKGKKHNYPEGVRVQKKNKSKKFIAGVSVGGVVEDHTSYDTVAHAMNAYRENKTKVVRAAMEKAYTSGEIPKILYEKYKDYTFDYSKEEKQQYGIQ